MAHQGGFGDVGHHHTELFIYKYNEGTVDRVRAAVGGEPTQADLDIYAQPDEITHAVGNLFTASGLNMITSVITGASTGYPLGASTNTRLGVGNGSTVLVTDTDLAASAGSSNRYFQRLYQNATRTTTTATNDTINVSATFDTSTANFAWNEWGVDLGASTVSSGATVNHILFNHKAQSLGTKSAGTIWSAFGTIQIT